MLNSSQPSLHATFFSCRLFHPVILIFEDTKVAIPVGRFSDIIFTYVFVRLLTNRTQITAALFGVTNLLC